MSGGTVGNYNNNHVVNALMPTGMMRNVQSSEYGALTSLVNDFSNGILSRVDNKLNSYQPPAQIVQTPPPIQQTPSQRVPFQGMSQTPFQGMSPMQTNYPIQPMYRPVPGSGK